DIDTEFAGKRFVQPAIAHRDRAAVVLLRLPPEGVIRWDMTPAVLITPVEPCADIGHTPVNLFDQHAPTRAVDLDITDRACKLDIGFQFRGLNIIEEGALLNVGPVRVGTALHL